MRTELERAKAVVVEAEWKSKRAVQALQDSLRKNGELELKLREER